MWDKFCFGFPFFVLVLFFELGLKIHLILSLVFFDRYSNSVAAFFIFVIFRQLTFLFHFIFVSTLALDHFLLKRC